MNDNLNIDAGLKGLIPEWQPEEDVEVVDSQGMVSDYFLSCQETAQMNKIDEVFSSLIS